MSESSGRGDSRIAWMMAGVTLVTFAIALKAASIAGAFCPRDCISYPYHDAASRARRHWGRLARITALLVNGVLLARRAARA